MPVGPDDLGVGALGMRGPQTHSQTYPHTAGRQRGQLWLNGRRNGAVGGCWCKEAGG